MFLRRKGKYVPLVTPRQPVYHPPSSGANGIALQCPLCLCGGNVYNLNNFESPFPEMTDGNNSLEPLS